MDTKSFSVLVHVLLFLIVAQNVSAINSLPNKKCELEDSICLKNQAEATLNTFVQGIPKLGIKPIENMHIDYVEVRQNKLHYIMRNIVVKGLRNSIIDEISINMDFKVMRISFHSDLICNFEYKCDGEVYGFPIFGEGESEIIMNNLHVEIVISFEIVKNKQGKDIMNLKSFFYVADAYGGVHYYFGNLFNGKKALSVPAHKLMNLTWRTLNANYGRFFTNKIMEELFEAVKIFMRSWPLKDLAKYTNTHNNVRC